MSAESQQSTEDLIASLIYENLTAEFTKDHAENLSRIILEEVVRRVAPKIPAIRKWAKDKLKELEQENMALRIGANELEPWDEEWGEIYESRLRLAGKVDLLLSLLTELDKENQ